MNFIDRSHIQIRLEKTRGICHNQKGITWQNNYWIHFIVMILSIVSLYGHWQYIQAISLTYEKLRAKFEKKDYDKSNFEHMHKNKAKIIRKNKDYKRCLSGLSGQNVDQATKEDGTPQRRKSLFQQQSAGNHTLNLMSRNPCTHVKFDNYLKSFSPLLQCK
jgi:hypothetical protein